MDPELAMELARALEEARGALRDGEEAARVTESAEYQARTELGTGTIRSPEMVKRVERAHSIIEVMQASHALQAARIDEAAAALRRAHQALTAPRMTPAQEADGFVKLLDNGESIMLTPAQAARVRRLRPDLAPDFSMTIEHPVGTPPIEQGAWYRLPHVEVIERGPFAGLTNLEVAKLTPAQREGMVAAAGSDILPTRVRQFLTRHGAAALAAVPVVGGAAVAYLEAQRLLAIGQLPQALRPLFPAAPPPRGGSATTERQRPATTGTKSGGAESGLAAPPSTARK